MNTVSPAIFRKPLMASGSRQDQFVQKERAKNQRLAIIYLALAAVSLALFSFFFLYPQVKAFLQAPTTLKNLESEVGNYERVILPSLQESRTLKKAAYDQELSQVEQGLAKVFPADADKLGIVKRLEDFATAIHAKNPPFEFNSITFGAPVEGQGYTVLPISTSIYSSRTNFDRFLELINLSGRLDGEIPIRLMAVSNISIRYRGVDSRTGKDQGVDFTVKLNAYSRSF